MKRILFIFSLIPIFGFGQSELPELGTLYTQAEIPTVKILIDQDSLDILYLEENWYENHEYPATFIFQTAMTNDTIENVGLRFRGNTSREKIKKSFKISLNAFISGQKYQGVEKMNLNAEVNDPSMIRSRLCWDLFREYGVPASRSNHVNLYINDDYYGLYQNIEHVDEEFADTYFGNNTGNLYKCLYPANLDYISNNPDDYKLAPWGSRTYELKTNEELDDYTDLAEFIAALNQLSNAELECQLNSYFNVNSYLKVAAIDVLTGNWDGYIYNQNNFYLYQNPLTKQFNYIPYDLDNTWGIDWLDRNWSNRPIYSWSQTGQPRPLFNRLMDIESFRNIFSWHINHLLNSKFNNPDYENYILNLHDFVTSDALSDPYRPLDFGFSENDFLNALNDAWGGHVDYSILDFMDLRAESAAQQLDYIEIPPIIASLRQSFKAFPDSLNFQVNTEGPEAIEVELQYTINQGVQQSALFITNGSNHTLSIELPDDFFEIEYNISAVNQGLTRWAYCQEQTTRFDSSGLVLNEIMSSNQTTISDSYEEFDDWIELFNQQESAIDLGNYFLSDNHTSQAKWNLPNQEISSGQFELFWADKSIEQGAMHTNFKLDANGERVYLFKKESNLITLCDYVSIPALPSDFSYGRMTDGDGEWILFENSTPESSNEGTLNVAEVNEEFFNLYPNPTKGMVHFNQRISFELRDLSGRLISKGNTSKLDLSPYTSGIYLLRSMYGTHKIVLNRK